MKPCLSHIFCVLNQPACFSFQQGLNAEFPDGYPGLSSSAAHTHWWTSGSVTEVKDGKVLKIPPVPEAAPFLAVAVNVCGG